MAAPIIAQLWKKPKLDIDSESEEEKSFTDDELEEYLPKANESGGFDVPHFPNTRAPGRIEPILPLDEEMEKLVSLSKTALSEMHPNYEFRTVKKANYQAVAGLMYYITFEATIAGADTPAVETFRAQVWDGVGGKVEVMSCQKKI